MYYANHPPENNDICRMTIVIDAVAEHTKAMTMINRPQIYTYKH